ncbi:MAG TPA: hypothetical protein VD793_11585 [Gemmatimonadales bacterium]|nr:hypothetical protein [Gemmatimonadales bacterium]
MPQRIRLPPTEADWQREAGWELRSALDAAQCGTRLLRRLAQAPAERELAHAISVALARAELAARRAGLTSGIS